MSATYFGILTKIGEAKQANALALGGSLKISHLAVGDGGGNTPTPDREQLRLIGEWRRAPLNQLYVHADNPNYLVAEQVIPETEGGKWIREWGLYDDDGDMVAVANCPPTYKPMLAEGSGRTQVVRMVIMVASTAAFALKIDPAVVLATREYVDTGLAGKQPKGHYAPVYSILSLPPTDIGPIVVAECSEVWIWSASEYFTGYRSPLCGRPLDGHTSTPLVSEVDAMGGLLDKAAYARLWGYAQENGLVVTQAAWDANRGGHYFVNVNGAQFRTPDLRDMFRRFTGTAVDTATARTLGSRQADAMQKITGRIQARSAISATGAIIGSSGAFAAHVKTEATNSAPIAFDPNITNGDAVSFDSSRVVRTSTETRSMNVAFHPRIHT
ncbi:hypothetical protein D3C71_1015350 [compost metagenome]